MKNLALTSILFLLFGSIVSSQPIPPDSMYLGQIPPGNIRKIFNLTPDPGYFAAEKIAISLDGKEIYYEEANSSWTSFNLKYYKYFNNQWNGPTNLFNNFYCLSLSPDGNFMYFENNSYNDSWISNKQGTAWNLPLRFLNNFAVHSLNLTNLGNYYFSSNITGGLGQRDICKLIVVNSDTTLVGLGRPLNSSANDGDFLISNDESFIILMSNRTGGIGSTDLYISYRKSYTNDTWTNPKNLGTSINTSGDDFGPYVTADNKYLFYESGYSGPSSVYWIRIDSLIDSLRNTNFVPYLNGVIPNQTDTVGQLFNYTIPDSTFIDDDGNNTLTYSAKLYNGSPLPTWLTFDSLNHNFNGTPSIVQTLTIKVTVTDSAGATIFTTFKIFVKAPAAINQINDKNSGFRIFPNPSNGLINISSDEFLGKTVTLEVNDLEGKIILKDMFIDYISIDLSSKPKGIYVLKFLVDKKVIAHSICLE